MTDRELTDRERFYADRDRRTVEYGVPDIFESPVALVVGTQAARCVRGQLAALALVNMLARIHRHLCFQVPAVPLLCPSAMPTSRLDEAVELLARTADPFSVLSHDLGKAATAIGLGSDAPVGMPWYIGANGQVAILDRYAAAFDEASTPSLGACLAACLGASAALRSILGKQVRAARISAWTFTEAPEAIEGPSALGPVNVGDVLQVGAGGVGSSLAYWLRHFGIRGNWCLLDGDIVKLHNTNRSLALFPKHAGWSDGNPLNKAAVVSSLIGAEPVTMWYDQFNNDGRRFDLVLPLANERSVRHWIACRGEPLLLHATTSLHWEAQFHRHLPEVDDCINCRMPKQRADVQMECSTVPLSSSQDHSTDAALPFLSATAGLLLLSGLFRLQEGELFDDRHNLWAIGFDNPRQHIRRARHYCQADCSTTLAPAIRRRIHAGRRWSALDIRAGV